MCVSNLNPKLVLTIKHRPEQVLTINIDSSTSYPVVNIDAVKIDLLDCTTFTTRHLYSSIPYYLYANIYRKWKRVDMYYTQLCRYFDNKLRLFRHIN